MNALTAHRDWEPAYQALTYAGDRLTMQRAERAKEREARDVIAEAAGGGR